MKTQTKAAAGGGAFLLHPIHDFDVLTPEALSEETLMFARTTEDFIFNRVLPQRDKLEALDLDLTVKLLREAAEIGLLMVDIPKAYGGLGLPKASSMAVKEKMALGASFSVSAGAHAGIGTLPIVYFGDARQREAYLPKLAAAEVLSCYALTEPGSGSDALAARTTAKLSEDGKCYVLNGTKQFITNGGFADIAVVFAKVDGEKFTGFIVDLKSPGVSTGPEEKKMGIRGSSTRQLILENVSVPVENVLGEIGKGHRIAFSILNMGRYTLGIGCIGASKHLIEKATRYAAQRHQFKQPIGEFGAIQEKLARVAALVFAGEAIAYRLAGDMDALSVEIVDDATQKQAMEVVENFSIEGAILKVFGSEVLDEVADEAVQIHGGYGFIEEYEVCAAYRDARINRIFEGTNEINRMLIPGMLVRKAMRGQLDVFTHLEAASKATETGKLLYEGSDDGAPPELSLVEAWKQAYLYLSNMAFQKLGEEMRQAQELLMAMADMVIGIYTTETALYRAAHLDHHRQLGEQLAKLYVYRWSKKMRALCQDAVYAFLDEAEAGRVAQKIEKILPPYRLDWVSLSRAAARTLLTEGKYPLGL